MLTIWSAVALALFAVCAYAGNSTLQNGREFWLKRFEDKIVERRVSSSDYDDVREYIRAKREKRPPRLTPDQADAAHKTAQSIADKEFPGTKIED